MDIEDKIDLLLYMFAIFCALFTISLVTTIKRLLFPRLLTRRTDRLRLLESQGKHDKIIKKADWYIEDYPNEVFFHWMKGKALYKINRHTEALEIFREIASSEPLWKEDAEKYIANINEKLNS